MRLAIAVLALAVICYELYRGQWIYVPIGLLVLLACFFRREHVVSPQGVDIRHILFGGKSHDLWTWDSITSIHTDRRRSAPNVALHIGRGVVTRVFVVTPEDCRTVLELAKEKNPKISFGDIR